MSVPPQGAFAVLRSTPGGTRLLVSSLFARIPSGAIGVLLVLRVRELGGSYGLGGLTAAADGLGVAFSAPLLGRLVDRRGQSGVLAVGGAVAAGALAALGLVGHGTAPGVLIVLAAIVGVAIPPLAACLRTLWPDLLPDPVARNALFALEASALELSFLLGPLLLVGVVAALSSVGTALVTSGLILLTGITWFGTHPASRRWRGSAAPGLRSWRGPLASPGLRALIVLTFVMGISFGAIEVGVAAFATHHHARGATGPLLAAWGAGSALGGLYLATRGATATPERILVPLLVVLAITDVAVLAGAGGWGLAALLPIAGAPIAPCFAMVYAACTAAAPEGTATEAFTWLSTGIGSGIAAGSAIAGGLADSGGARADFALAAVAAVLALVVTRGGLRRSTVPA